MATGKFGDLRSLVHADPTPQSWIALCAEVRRWPAEQFHDEFKPYVLHALERWPDRLRVMPPDWIRHLIEGRGQGWHVTSMVRSLAISRPTPSADLAAWQATAITPQLTRLAQHDWSSLRDLSLELPMSVAGWRALTQAPWFRALHSLSLHQSAWDDSLHEAIWLDAPPLHLRALSLWCGPHSHSVGAGLSLHQWPNLRSLSLAQSATDHDFWSGLTDTFPRLEDLTLRDCMYWPESFTALARCSWLPNLRSLTTNLLPRLNPPRQLNYERYEGDYDDNYYNEIDELDTDSGELDFESIAHRALLSNDEMRSLERLEVLDQLTQPIIDTIADAPNLHTLKNLSWQENLYPNYYRYQRNYNYNYYAHHRYDRHEGTTIPARFMASATLSDDLKRWLREQHSAPTISTDRDDYFW